MNLNVKLLSIVLMVPMAKSLLNTKPRQLELVNKRLSLVLITNTSQVNLYLNIKKPEKLSVSIFFSTITLKKRETNSLVLKFIKPIPLP